MRNVLDFITQKLHWFIFAGLEIIALILLFSYNGYQRAAWVSSANTLAGTIYGIKSEIASFFSLTELNSELTQRNNYLQWQVENLSQELLDMGADTTKVDAIKALPGYSMIPAKVVSNSVNKRDNLITIDKGEADGVKKDMAVISGTGVVGVVFIVGQHYSVVIPALSSKSSISCKISRTGYFGYLKWDGRYSNMAYVEDVPRHAHFKLYDKVVTSGFSSIFPAGIPVGKILHIRNSDNGLSYKLQVQLYTDFANLRDVCVVDNSNLHEQLQVAREAQDSLSINSAGDE